MGKLLRLPPAPGLCYIGKTVIRMFEAEKVTSYQGHIFPLILCNEVNDSFILIIISSPRLTIASNHNNFI